MEPTGCWEGKKASESPGSWGTRSISSSAEAWSYRTGRSHHSPPLANSQFWSRLQGWSGDEGVGCVAGVSAEIAWMPPHQWASRGRRRSLSQVSFRGVVLPFSINSASSRGGTALKPCSTTACCLQAEGQHPPLSWVESPPAGEEHLGR